MKQEWKKGWKVISIGDHNKRTSYVEDDFAVSYRKNKIARPLPKCGPLAVFKYKSNAKDFACDLAEHTRIVPCLYLKSNDDHLWTPNGHISTFFPTGTIFADAVKCLE